MNYATTWIEAKRLGGVEISLLRKLMAQAAPDAINLALGELGFAFPETLAQHAIELLKYADPRYTPNAGLSDLRQRIALEYGDNYDSVCVCNGAEEALYIAIHALIDQGDIVAIPDPDYPAYPTLARLAGAEVIRLPYNKDFSSIDWDAWESKLLGAKLLLMSSPSNPAGYTLNQEDSRRLGDIVSRTGTILIIDEIYKEVYCDKPEQSLYEMFPRLIRIGGLSKSHLMSGWRIGWIHADATLIDSATKLKQYVSTCPAWLSQMLALYALDCPDIPLQVQVKLRENREIIRNALKQYKLHLPPASPYALVHSEDSSKQALDWMKMGVITVPGTAFGRISNSVIRLNYAVDKQTLLNALERLG